MSENMQQEFPAYYTALCARVADAIDALEQQNYGAARDALISGMQEAEEIILAQEDGSILQSFIIYSLSIIFYKKVPVRQYG